MTTYEDLSAKFADMSAPTWTQYAETPFGNLLVTANPHHRNGAGHGSRLHLAPCGELSESEAITISPNGSRTVNFRAVEAEARRLWSEVTPRFVTPSNVITVNRVNYRATLNAELASFLPSEAYVALKEGGGIAVTDLSAAARRKVAAWLLENWETFFPLGYVEAREVARLRARVARLDKEDDEAAHLAAVRSLKRHEVQGDIADALGALEAIAAAEVGNE